MSINSIEDYVEQSRRILDSSGQLDEMTTRSKLIDPFVRTLGWNLFSTEVQLEHTVGMMATDKKVDYALQIEGDPKVFIEAKAADTDISEKAVNQLKDYMRNEWVRFGLVTNGREFTPLTLRANKNGPPDILELGTISFEDLPKNAWLLELLSRDAIERGDAEDIVSDLERREQALDHLQSNRETLATEVVDVVSEDIDDALRQEFTTRAETFIDELITLLETGTWVDPTKGDDDPDEKRSLTELEPPLERDLPTTNLDDLDGPAETSVVVAPARLDRGFEFLFRNNAWGFVRIDRNPKYIAFYITGTDPSAVWYIGEIARIATLEETDIPDDPADYIDLDDPSERQKKVIELKPDSLRQLEKPIPYSKKYPQSLRYTTLGQLRKAETTNDLF